MLALPKIILLLIAIESGNMPNPPDGDGGKAVGVLQMHPIAVREANRIAGREIYTLNDRKSRVRSMQMCSLILSYRVTKYKQRYGKSPSDQLLMESWQSGRLGKRATLQYQEKVERVLKGTH